ncbi:MAG: phosphatase PAP2 family protein [Ramlibacter sp.]|nr:phosphatase PAP2 family protein [Ramlibacter sp.]
MSSALAGMTTPWFNPAALILSRAALAGPFKGDTLPIDLPAPIDKASRLSRWAPAPRLLVCNLEALSGLAFVDDPAHDELALAFADLSADQPVRQPLVALRRPTEAIFKEQLEFVSLYADLRDDRGGEILAQIGGGLDFLASVVALTSHRHKYTLELIDMAIALGLHVKMRFKHAFACQRPIDLSPQIQPMIPTPGHGSWPSGHASEAYLLITILQALLPDGHVYMEQLERLAARIAVNRTVAGLHFPVDSAAGRLLGTALGHFFVARCKGIDVHERGFDGSKFRKDGAAIDFDPRVSISDGSSGYYQIGRTIPIAASSILSYMWEKAAAEWKLST